MSKKKTEQTENTTENVNEGVADEMPEEVTEGKANGKTESNGKTEEAKQPSEVEKLTALAEDYKRKWYSVSAEYDNYRKRNATSVATAYADGKAEAIKKLLPVADNFGYAYDSASDEKTKQGIDKIIKSFKNILSSLGVEEIAVNIGDEFDESVMDAIMNMPAEEGQAVGTVKQVLKKGYRQDGKVIRFAQVIVNS